MTNVRWCRKEIRCCGQCPHIKNHGFDVFYCGKIGDELGVFGRDVDHHDGEYIHPLCPLPKAEERDD